MMDYGTDKKWYYIGLMRDPLDRDGQVLIDMMDYFEVDGLYILTDEQCKSYYENVFLKRIKRRNHGQEDHSYKS